MRAAVEETATSLTFRLRTPGWMRIALAGLSVLPLLAPYELLVRPRWTGEPSLWLIVPLVVSAGAIALSVGLVAAAALGVSQRVRFDFAGGVLRFSSIAPLKRSAMRRYPFAAVRAIHGWREASTDGPDDHGLRVELDDGTSVRIGPVASADKARAWLELLRDRGLPVGNVVALETRS